MTLNALPPERRLLAALARRIAPEHLHIIAHGDYGRDVELHFEALMRLHDTAEVPASFDWHPREVLELFGWSEDADRGRGDAFPPEAQRFVRAFCCTALLLQSDPENDYDEKLFALSETLSVLPGDWMEHFLALLMWMEDAETPGASTAFIAVVRLLAELEHVQVDAAHRSLESVMAHESDMLMQSRDRLDCDRFGGVRSLIGTPHWQRLGTRLVAAAPKAGDPLRQGLIELIGRSLIAIPAAR